MSTTNLTKKKKKKKKRTKQNKTKHKTVLNPGARSRRVNISYLKNYIYTLHFLRSIFD